MTRHISKIFFCFSILSFNVVIAGETPWFNTDLPGGSGDYENNERYLKVQCRLMGKVYTPAQAGQLPKGYYCNKSRGAWCENQQTSPINSCKDMQVKWHWGTNSWHTGSNWPAGQTPWFNRDRQSGSGDYELIEHQLKPICKFGNKIFSPSNSLPAGYTCDKKRGAWCQNKLTQPKNRCKDLPVTIKYKW